MLRSPDFKLAFKHGSMMMVKKTLATSAAVALPTFPTVPEDCVSPFVFYLNNQLHHGIRYINELYGLVDEFRVHQRLAAYQSVSELIEQGNDVLMTVSAGYYRSWINLRSPNCLHHF